jgi:hypothetical protein
MGLGLGDAGGYRRRIHGRPRPLTQEREGEEKTMCTSGPKA